MEFLFQISSGLAEAHRYGVTHRDVKPANIMLDKDGRVRLLDFGVAHDDRDQELTEDFAQLGTASYMSPEQVRDSKNITPASDVYSIGIIACIVLISMGCCAIQFAFGRKSSVDPVTKVTAGQSLGQKNTGFLIWLGYNYMTPVTSVAGGLYAIWQNIFNSWELYEKNHHGKKASENEEPGTK
jgi:serine/threonine protein kinase